MHDTVVTIEPTNLVAKLSDHQVAIALETNDVRIHVQGPRESNSEAKNRTIILSIEGADSDLYAKIELTPVDAEVLVHGLNRILSSSERGAS